MRYINPPKQVTDDKTLMKILKKELKKTTALSKELKLTIPLIKAMPKLDTPIVRFSIQAEQKYKALIATCAIEIAWHGLVKYNEEDNEYYVYDIIVYGQDATPATVEADDNYPQWLMELSDEDFDALRLQGHSHVDFGVSPSGTDTNYYYDIIAQSPPYQIFMIANKRGALWIELYDFKNNAVFETSDILVMYDSDTWAKANIEEHVATTGTRATIYGTKVKGKNQSNVSQIQMVEDDYYGYEGYHTGVWPQGGR
jgi:hypothetical protein